MKILTIFMILIILPSVAGAPLAVASQSYTATVTSTSTPTNNNGGGGSSGGSGRSGSGLNCNEEYWINSINCQEYVCPKYIKANDCKSEPASNHLCCINYYNPKMERYTYVKTPIPNETKEVEQKEENITQLDEDAPILYALNQTEETNEEEEKMNWTTIFAYIIAALVLLTPAIFAIRREIKKQKQEADNDRGTEI